MPQTARHRHGDTRKRFTRWHSTIPFKISHFYIAMSDKHRTFVQSMSMPVMYRLPGWSKRKDAVLLLLCFFFFVNFYKHIPMQHSQKSPPVQPPSHRRSLHRTLSDESIYRGQRLPPLSDSVTEPTLGSDVLFSCSTLPRSPTTRGVPLRRPSYKLGVKLHGKDEDGACTEAF